MTGFVRFYRCLINTESGQRSLNSAHNVMPGELVRYVYNTQPLWEEVTE